ncbi:MAG: PBP1A family penicillin-binding protein [Candidatus Pacebacteria bacterium]|nr:PBP1A family penicillin-binding protein [Candidatus Paceibacterota bacterium]
MKKTFKAIISMVDRTVSLLEWRIQRLFHKKGSKKISHIIRDIILIFLIIGVLSATIFLVWASSLRTPDLSSFDDRLLGQSAKIYDRTGKVLLYDLSQKVRRTVVPFDTISPYLKQATIAIEDIDFYNHGGIKATSIARAILANIFSLKYSQGGSTITQQVVKNSLLTKNKDISRKLKEWVLAVKLEKTTDKDTILNLYLNETPYGGNIYGVEEATQAYFAKKSSDLTLAEAAYIAALPQAPSLYSPYGQNKNLLVERKNLVLKKMYENKLITEEQYTTALKEQVLFQPKNIGGIKAPHFVMYVKDYLEQKYGTEMLEKGGFKITTTLDWDLEQKAEEIVSRYVKTNETKFKASNGSLVAIDPKTGQILVMVGSRDYFDKDIEGNFNVAIARRQPGSAFKPFVYATGFNKGMTPSTPIFDVPTQFNSSCGADNKPLPSSPNADCYEPQNYEGGFKGLMSIRSALAESRNVPAVRALHIVGVEDSIKTATDMGIQNLSSAAQYGLSLALGGAEVSVLDITSAYGVFANGGEKAKVTPILKIETNDEVVVEEFSSTTKQVIPKQSALLIDDILSDPYARSSIFGTRYFGDRQVAIKSGTTNNSRDAWVLGYTPSISVGSWMGNNNNTPMVQQASARIIGPMWKEFMDYALTKIPDEKFEAPEPISSSTKPFLIGTWKGPQNEIHSELYWLNKNDIQGDVPGNNSKDSLFKLYENGVQNWAANQGYTLINNTQPTTTLNTPGFKITSPLNGTLLLKNERSTITVEGFGNQTTQVEYYINDKIVGKSTESPYSFSFIPSSIPGIEPENDLKAIATERVGKFLEAKTIFTVQ